MREHPSPEQTIFRLAVEKALTPEQRALWEAWNYDRETLESIGQRIGISKQAVSKRLAKVQRLITEWCKRHKEVYDALSGAANGDQA